MHTVKMLALTLLFGPAFSDEWTGTILPRPDGAQTNVVAVLHPMPSAKTHCDLNLLASGEIAKQLVELARTHTLVKVSGVADADGILVDAVGDMLARLRKRSSK